MVTQFTELYFVLIILDVLESSYVCVSCDLLAHLFSIEKSLQPAHVGVRHGDVIVYFSVDCLGNRTTSVRVDIVRERVGGVRWEGGGGVRDEGCVLLGPFTCS